MPAIIRRIARILCLCLCALLCGCAAAPAPSPAPTEEQGLLLSASFYPAYLAALQVAGGVPGVRVTTFLQPQGGYLEHYRLSVLDWERAQRAGVLLLMGGGLEDFLPVFLGEESSPVLVAGENIQRIPGRVLDPDEDTEPAHNPYIWLSPQRWAETVHGIAAGMAQIDPERAAAYIANNDVAQHRLEAASARLAEAMAPYQGRPVVVMHPALAYLAQEAGLEVVLTLERDPSLRPSAEDLAEFTALIEPFPDAVLLMERDAPLALQALSAHVALCETLCVGIRDGDASAWERALDGNIAALVSALHAAQEHGSAAPALGPFAPE